jgi:mRNA interferase MazF
MKPADVVLVKFPFSDLESSKKRPVLILSCSDLTSKVRLVTLAMITSKIDGLKLPGDYIIKNWKEAHLLHPSLLRLSKVATVEAELVDKRLGRLSLTDIKGIQQAFQRQFKFWI